MQKTNIYPKVIVHVQYNDKHLCIRHPNQKHFELIGGNIKINESPSQAALRELKEESGITEVRELSYISKYEYFKKVTGKLELRHIFSVTLNDDYTRKPNHIGTGNGCDKDQTFELLWEDREKIKKLLFHDMADVLEKALDYRKKY